MLSVTSAGHCCDKQICFCFAASASRHPARLCEREKIAQERGNDIIHEGKALMKATQGISHCCATA